MANLPNFADRLNDIEVTANAPLTETLIRKFGSNVNFILDFLGVTNGSTTPSGSLNDLAVAIELVRNHTITLQYTLPGNGTHTVGSFPTIPFIDFVFWTTFTPSVGAGSGGRIVIQHSVDGGPYTLPGGSITTPGSTGLGTTSFPDEDAGTSDNHFQGTTDGTSVTDVASRLGIDAVLGATGYEHKMRSRALEKGFTLSWRDGAQHDVRLYHEGGAGQEIYLGYKLNLESAPLAF